MPAGELHNAIFGGILSFYAATIGMAGMVIDGAIRDVAEIRERTSRSTRRGVTHRGPYKDGPGEINVPVCVGGMVVNPGDIVVGDQDGLLAFPQAEAAEADRKGQGAAAEGRADDAGHARGPLGSLLHRCARSARHQLRSLP